MDDLEFLNYAYFTLRLTSRKALEWIEKGDIERAKRYLWAGIWKTEEKPEAPQVIVFDRGET